MSNIVEYWEEEGFLFSVPDDLKYDVAMALEKKAVNVREGKDFKDQQEDYDQLVNDYLDKEFLDED